MTKKVGHLLLVCALLAALGGHWVLLQSVAWTTMLADNLRSASFSEAVQRTFDGKHPCSLCKNIAEGKKAEKKSDFPPLLNKFEFIAERTAFVFNAPQNFRLLPESEFRGGHYSRQPPLRPPRQFPA